ncbi:MAG: ATP-binding protein, partial [Anaerolinea sp.]|nr:ATP-binding protein [Anaerolinea sp.]
QIRPDIALVSECIDRVRRWLRNSWKYKDTHAHRVIFDIPSDLPMVLADKRGISTVLQLLIDNALKFSDGRVEIAVEMGRNGVRFTVTDCGIGISPDERSRIFDLFYQSDSGASRRAGGAGIGLAIAERIAARHNTVIEVSSEIGRGSAFSFIVPLAKIS